MPRSRKTGTRVTQVENPEARAFFHEPRWNTTFGSAVPESRRGSPNLWSSTARKQKGLCAGAFFFSGCVSRLATDHQQDGAVSVPLHKKHHKATVQLAKTTVWVLSSVRPSSLDMRAYKNIKDKACRGRNNSLNDTNMT